MKFAWEIMEDISPEYYNISDKLIFLVMTGAMQLNFRNLATFRISW